MAERRSLVEQIEPATEVARTVEEEFVYGHKGRPARSKQEQTPPRSAEPGADSAHRRAQPAGRHDRRRADHPFW